MAQTAHKRPAVTDRERTDHREGGKVGRFRRSSCCGQKVELLKRCHVVKLTSRRITVNQPDQSWLQLLVHVPDCLKQPTSNGEVVATFNGIGSVLTSGDCDLSFGGKPKVHPQWQVHEDDRVREDHPIFKR